MMDGMDYTPGGVVFLTLKAGVCWIAFGVLF
jgi:hypothetical protein